MITQYASCEDYDYVLVLYICVQFNLGPAPKAAAKVWNKWQELQRLNFRIIAVGNSFNDIDMWLARKVLLTERQCPTILRIFIELTLTYPVNY